jgi:hypothetical protein
MEKIIIEVPEEKMDRLKKVLDERELNFTQEKEKIDVLHCKELLTKISTWSESDLAEIENSKFKLGTIFKEEW